MPSTVNERVVKTSSGTAEEREEKIKKKISLKITAEVNRIVFRRSIIMMNVFF